MIKPVIVLAFSVFMAGCNAEQKSTEPVESLNSEPVESLNSVTKPYTLDWVDSNQTIPHNANQYKADLIRFTQASFGINAPISLAAAQIHKESTWRETAKSPYAEGLTQFTPQTQVHIKKKYPVLAYGDALNPIWAMQAMTLYNKELKTAVDAIDECNDWAFTHAMYNGGSGWIWREKNLAEEAGVDRNQYWQAVETFNAGRRASAKKENRGYPKKIILELQMLYYNNGWGGLTVCTEN